MVALVFVRAHTQLRELRLLVVRAVRFPIAQVHIVVPVQALA